MIRTLAALCLAAASLAAPAAQSPAPNSPVHVRGTVESLKDTALTVKARDGKTLHIKLADDFTVTGVSKARLEDLGTGKFIGTTTVGERNGALVAIEVHIFPESMRGTGEGHRDWDLKPDSKMTNANVAEITSVGKDRMMTVEYKGGEQKVLVPPTASIVSFVPGDRKELKRGAKIFCIAQPQPDGSLTAARVNVGLKGLVPPM